MLGMISRVLRDRLALCSLSVLVGRAAVRAADPLVNSRDTKEVKSTSSHVEVRPMVGLAGLGRDSTLRQGKSNFT